MKLKSQSESLQAMKIPAQVLEIEGVKFLQFLDGHGSRLYTGGSIWLLGDISHLRRDPKEF